jgi:uncharacterized membrane protein
MFETSHLHPMIVHFPIALITIGFLADLLSIFLKKEHCLSKVGFYLMILGTLSAVAAYLTGEFFTGEMTGAAGEVKENHELFAKIAMFVIGIASIIRIYLIIKKVEDGNLKWLVFALYAIAMISVGIAGFLGGTLVYNYMMPL